MMHMTFYWGRQVTVLFDDWRTTTLTEYGITLVALFLFAVFFEFLSSRRASFALALATSSKSEREQPLLPALPRRREDLIRSKHVFQVMEALLFGINAGLGYLLMLAVMSFNGGVLIAVVLGLTVGHFIFRNTDPTVAEAHSNSESCPC